MKITTVRSENTVTFTLEGRLDTQTVAQLRSETQGVDFDTVERVIFDFRDVEYVSSAGLRELLIVRKRFSDSEQVQVVGVSPEVMDVFQVTGFDTLLSVHQATEDTAANFITMSFKEILTERALHCPERFFLLTHDSLGYTWSQIDKCAHIIAMDLYKKGVRKGTHVGIYGKNSANWVLTFFAVQKIGALACLINDAYTTSELATVCAVGDVTHICCGETAHVQNFESFVDTITTDEDAMILDVIDIRNSVDFLARVDEYDTFEGYFQNKVESDDAAVMIFTSGSTGKPKGVLLSAYNILNATMVHMKEINHSEEDKACLILPLFHIFGLLSGLLTGVLANAQVYIPKDIRTDTVLSALCEDKCTILHSVPTMLLALINNKNFCREKVVSLRSTILAGAPITEAQLLKLQQEFPNNHFSISYGLSEMAPVTMTTYEDTMEHLVHTVGKPVENISIKIRNPQTNESCPAGVVGEIMVQGYNLMTAYYKLDIDNQSLNDEGWLHTGDLGFIDKDGYVHLSGRIKELIIRGGENIMPGELAGAISEYHAISDVKVMGVPDDFFGEVPAAALVLKQGEEFDEQALRSFLQTKLTKQKIPSYFFVYEAFPVLSNGKVDAVNLKKEIVAKVQTLKNN